MGKKDVELGLWVEQDQLEAWTRMANRMCLNIYEYIRRCTNAHTNILEKDFMHLVPDEK